MDANQFSQTYRDLDLQLDAQVVSDCVDGILKEFTLRVAKPLNQISVLDVGCGSGDYSLALARRVARVVGVEPDFAAVGHARMLKKGSSLNVEFRHGFIEDMHFDEKFDLAVSLTTVEHMPDAPRSFARVLELLKPGGIIYLTAPNKLWPMECHYHLPFLSWLPLPLANLYLRLSRRGRSYEDCSYMRTYWGMKKLFADLNCEATFVLPDLNNSYIGVGDTNPLRKWIRNTGIGLIRRFPSFWIISKAFLMIVRKP